jgi:hypothetical protein
MAEGKNSKGKHDKSSKQRHPPIPPSEEFKDSEFSDEQLSSMDEKSPPPIPRPSLSEDSEDSMGLSPAERACIWFVEWAGLEGSDDLDDDSEEEYQDDDNDEDGDSSEDGSGDNNKGVAATAVVR